MKQKRIEDTLYVFDVTPYTITEDRDASIIKVQQETYEGFVNQNPDIASKIVKYNYHMFTVNKQEWSDYVDEPDPAKKYKIEVTGVDDPYYINIAGYLPDGGVNWLSKDEIRDGEGQFIKCVYEYEAGLPFQVDERDSGIISAIPELSLSEEGLLGVGISYIMPNSDVELQLFRMPAADAQFDFNIFDSMESTESTASGTATWKGSWVGDPAADLPTNVKYVYAIANGQFTEGTAIEEMPLFIQMGDVYPLISGERVEVRSIVEGTTETGVLGYIEFSVQ